MKLIDLCREHSWQKALHESFKTKSCVKLESFLQKEYSEQSVFPPQNDLFNAFECTPFENVRVVILGQDPYHGLGQAHGLAFSVKKPCTVPPSLKNIFKELKQAPDHGDLSTWAEQGVLLLNTVLSVRQSQANSHRKQGWEEFTDSVIKKISDEKDFVIFVLWGGPAQKKKSLIDEKKHLILESSHPSPLSAYRGFLGCNHFEKINKTLQERDKSPIVWELERSKAEQLELF